MAQNQAAWLDGANQKLRVAEAPMPEPDDVSQPSRSATGIIITCAAV